MRFAGRIMLVVFSVVFVLGLVRFSVNGFQGEFLPSYNTFLSWMVTFPDLAGEMRQVSEWFSQSSGNAFLDFFKDFGSTFVMIGSILSMPFRVLGWFFVNFFTPIATA